MRYTFMQTVDARAIKRITGRLPMVHRPDGSYTATLRPVVVLNETGRDCDGYDIDSIGYHLPETVEADIEHALEWADGPMHHGDISARDLRDWHEDRQRRERNDLRQGWDDDRF